MKSQVDMIVENDFLIGNQRYKKGDTFIYDDNNFIHNKYYQMRKFRELSEDSYKYICNIANLPIYDQIYKFGDEIKNANEIPTLKHLVKAGKIRKEFKEKQNVQPVVKDNKIPSEKTWKTLSIECGVSWNSFKEVLTKIGYEKIPHHNSKATPEDVVKIKGYFKNLGDK